MDRLFSTRRRPLLEILSDTANPAIDLLRPDAWMTRQQMLKIIGHRQLEKEFPAPGQHHWRFFINLFVRNQVDREGALINIPEAARVGHQIQMRAIRYRLGTNWSVARCFEANGGIEVSFSCQEPI